MNGEGEQKKSFVEKTKLGGDNWKRDLETLVKWKSIHTEQSRGHSFGKWELFEVQQQSKKTTAIFHAFWLIYGIVSALIVAQLKTLHYIILLNGFHAKCVCVPNWKQTNYAKTMGNAFAAKSFDSIETEIQKHKNKWIDRMGAIRTVWT